MKRAGKDMAMWNTALPFSACHRRAMHSDGPEHIFMSRTEGVSKVYLALLLLCMVSLQVTFGSARGGRGLRGGEPFRLGNNSCF